jgi:hypothetical protein
MSSTKEEKSVEQKKEDSKHDHKEIVNTAAAETSIEKKDLDSEEGKEQEEPTSLWTPVWDDSAQAYYWWNTETNETTWINPASTDEEAAAAPVQAATNLPANASNPLDFLLDRIDAVVKRKLDNGEDVDPADLPENKHYSADYDQQHYNQQPGEYTATAQFNARTGKFTTQDDASRLNPENLTIESRAKRQMQYYFDVDSYTEERNQEKAYVEDGRAGKKKQLSRKEIEYFKKMKKEKKSKKAREWLMQ